MSIKNFLLDTNEQPKEKRPVGRPAKERPQEGELIPCTTYSSEDGCLVFDIKQDERELFGLLMDIEDKMDFMALQKWIKREYFFRGDYHWRKRVYYIFDTYHFFDWVYYNNPDWEDGYFKYIPDMIKKFLTLLLERRYKNVFHFLTKQEKREVIKKEISYMLHQSRYRWNAEKCLFDNSIHEIFDYNERTKDEEAIYKKICKYE